MFPSTRPRRLRQSESLRRMVQENTLTANDMIYPLFAVPGESFSKEVVSMPGVYQLSVDKIVDEAKEVWELGIPAVILFGIPPIKTWKRRVHGTIVALFKRHRQRSKKQSQK